MSVFRIHLKSDTNSTFAELLDYCRNKGIVGIGWADVKTTVDDYDVLKKECKEKYPKDKGAFKSINAIRQIQPGDFIWTREGGQSTAYYLCRATDARWVDRVVSQDDINHDVTNYVGCKWVKVGNLDKVPGRVINSFRATSTAQHVYGVDTISAVIWNKLCEEGDRCEIPQIDNSDFWNNIGNEDLECLVLLYLQWKGYYIYSSTIKNDTKTYEAVLVSRDGKHKCYPQVKQNERLDPKDYVLDIDSSDKVILFSSNEDYGKPHPQVECLKRDEIWKFIMQNRVLLPDTVKYWIDLS